MGVSDGQAVDSAVTNAAFINKNSDDTMPNKLSMARIGSGTAIDDTQLLINRQSGATGADQNTNDGKTYSSQTVVSNGDNHEVAVGKLDQRFHGSTGHTHDGTNGNGPVVVQVATTSVKGKVQLQLNPSMPVNASNTAGTANATVANADHQHEGLHSVKAFGQGNILGDAVLQAGTNVTLVQSGSTITINASGAGGGPFHLVQASKTSTYTLTTSDDEINADTSGGAFTLTLPLASSDSGKVYVIKLVTAGFPLTLMRSGGDTIDTYTSLIMSTRGDSIIVTSDGTSKWNIIDYNILTGFGYHLSGNQTVPTATDYTVIWDTPDFDAQSIMNTGTGVATVAVSGTYNVNVISAWANATFTAGNGLTAHFLYNAFATDQRVNSENIQATGNFTFNLFGSSVIKLLAGDTIKVVENQGEATGRDLQGGAGHTMFSIIRSGN